MLALVSALVAFRGWPELGVAQEGAQGLVIEDTAADVQVQAVKVEGDGGALRTSRGSAGPDRTRSGGDDGGVGGGVNRPPAGGHTPAGQGPSGRDDGQATAPGDAVPQVPVDADLPGSTDVRNGLSDVTEGVGNTLNGVSPELGAPISGGGDKLGDALDESLPQSGDVVLPGTDVKLP